MEERYQQDSSTTQRKENKRIDETPLLERKLTRREMLNYMKDMGIGLATISIIGTGIHSATKVRESEKKVKIVKKPGEKNQHALSPAIENEDLSEKEKRWLVKFLKTTNMEPDKELIHLAKRDLYVVHGVGMKKAYIRSIERVMGALPLYHAAFEKGLKEVLGESYLSINTSVKMPGGRIVTISSDDLAYIFFPESIPSANGAVEVLAGSNANAKGLYQFLHGTYKNVLSKVKRDNIKYFYDISSMYIPFNSAYISGRHFGRILKGQRKNKDILLATVAYNAGEGRIRRVKDWREWYKGIRSRVFRRKYHITKRTLKEAGSYPGRFVAILAVLNDPNLKVKTRGGIPINVSDVHFLASNLLNPDEVKIEYIRSERNLKAVLEEHLRKALGDDYEKEDVDILYNLMNNFDDSIENKQRYYTPKGKTVLLLPKTKEAMDKLKDYYTLITTKDPKVFDEKMDALLEALNGEIISIDKESKEKIIARMEANIKSNFLNMAKSFMDAITEGGKAVLTSIGIVEATSEKTREKTEKKERRVERKIKKEEKKLVKAIKESKKAIIYRVRRGDTPYGLEMLVAKLHKISRREARELIKAYNPNYNSRRIYVREKIIIPLPEHYKKVGIVRRGYTISRIKRLYGNRSVVLSGGRTIYPGQIILAPRK